MPGGARRDAVGGVAPVGAGQQPAAGQQPGHRAGRPVAGGRVVQVAHHQDRVRRGGVEAAAVGVLVIGAPELSGAVHRVPQPEPTHIGRPGVFCGGHRRPRPRAVRIAAVRAHHRRNQFDGVGVFRRRLQHRGRDPPVALAQRRPPCVRQCRRAQLVDGRSQQRDRRRTLLGVQREDSGGDELLVGEGDVAFGVLDHQRLALQSRGDPGEGAPRIGDATDLGGAFAAPQHLLQRSTGGRGGVHSHRHRCLRGACRPHPFGGIDHPVDGDRPHPVREHVGVHLPEVGAVGEAEKGQLPVTDRAAQHVHVAGHLGGGDGRRQPASEARAAPGQFARRAHETSLFATSDREAHPDQGSGHPVEPAHGREAAGGGAAVGAAWVHADQVEPVQHLGSHPFPGADRKLGAGAARAARVEEQAADPARRVAGRDAGDRDVDGLAVRLVVVERQPHRRTLDELAVAPVQLRGRDTVDPAPFHGGRGRRHCLCGPGCQRDQ